MWSLLLDEEDYVGALNKLAKFAKDHDIAMSGTSEDILEVAATILLGIKLKPEDAVMLTKLVYNVGFRDNNLKNLHIH